jgi:hypothetical protein
VVRWYGGTVVRWYGGTIAHYRRFIYRCFIYRRFIYRRSIEISLLSTPGDPDRHIGWRRAEYHP